MRRRWGERLHVLQDEAVRFYGQPIAVVVARSLVQAEHQLYGSGRVIGERRLFFEGCARAEGNTSLPAEYMTLLSRWRTQRDSVADGNIGTESRRVTQG